MCVVQKPVVHIVHQPVWCLFSPSATSDVIVLKVTDRQAAIWAAQRGMSALYTVTALTCCMPPYWALGVWTAHSLHACTKELPGLGHAATYLPYRRTPRCIIIINCTCLSHGLPTMGHISRSVSNTFRGGGRSYTLKSSNTSHAFNVQDSMTPCSFSGVNPFQRQQGWKAWTPLDTASAVDFGLYQFLQTIRTLSTIRDYLHF